MRRNRTRFVLLGLLAEAPKTGYELKQEIDEAIGHFWSESYGQIYPQLQRLADEGLAERLTESNGRRERHVYRITEAGRAELGSWLEEPPEPEAVRHELLLKLYFGRNTRPEVLQRHLHAFRVRAQQFLAMLEAVEAQIGAMPEVPDKPYWLLTLGAGEAVARTRLDWAAEAIEVLQGLPARPGAQHSDGEGKDESQMA